MSKEWKERILDEKKTQEQHSEGRMRELQDRQRLIQENEDHLWDELSELLNAEVSEFNKLRAAPQGRHVTFDSLPHKEIKLGTTFFPAASLTVTLERGEGRLTCEYYHKLDQDSRELVIPRSYFLEPGSALLLRKGFPTGQRVERDRIAEELLSTVFRYISGV